MRTHATLGLLVAVTLVGCGEVTATAPDADGGGVVAPTAGTGGSGGTGAGAGSGQQGGATGAGGSGQVSTGGSGGTGDVGGSAGGAPACPSAHQVQCSGQCVNAWSEANCGFCGHVCANGICNAGTCTVDGGGRGTLAAGAPCGIDAECLSPLYCVNNACALKTCATSAQCTNGEQCYAWKTTTACSSSAPDGCACGGG